MNAIETSLQVDLWFVPLVGSPATVAEARQQLDETETARAERFHFEPDRRRYMLAHAALRTLLGQRLRIPPTAVRFKTGSAGKPTVDADLHFNLSHSGDFALIGITTDGPLGVDIENVIRSVDTDEIVERFFAPAEQTAWQQLDPAEKTTGFFRAWTRKEAYVKARGTGLSHDSNRYAVTFTSDDDVRLLHDDIDPSAAAGFQLFSIPAPEGYEAAGAVQIPSPNPVTTIVHAWS